jgi:hypothetical protein
LRARSGGVVSEKCVDALLRSVLFFVSEASHSVQHPFTSLIETKLVEPIMAANQTNQDNNVVEGEYLFGVPINPFHSFPGPCPVISETRPKPIKVHVQTNKLRIIIPVPNTNETIAWLKDEFKRRAVKHGHRGKLKEVYCNGHLLSDNLRVIECLKNGDVIKEGIEGEKRKYKKGGHKKLARVSNLLNSHLSEMMSTENDNIRKKFYRRICNLPQIVNEGLGMDEVISWFKRAKKRTLNKDEEKIETEAQLSIDAFEGRIAKKIRAEPTPVQSNEKGPPFLPIRTKPTVAFATTLVTELGPPTESGRGLMSSISTSTLPPLQPHHHCHESSQQCQGMMMASRSSSAASSPMSWREMFKQSIPLSPSALSISEFLTPKHSEDEGGDQDENCENYSKSPRTPKTPREGGKDTCCFPTNADTRPRESLQL